MIPDCQIIIPGARLFGTYVSLICTIFSIPRTGTGIKQLLPRCEDDDAADVNVMPPVKIIIAEGGYLRRPHRCPPAVDVGPMVVLALLMVSQVWREAFPGSAMIPVLLLLFAASVWTE